jgi:hypothetical protein
VRNPLRAVLRTPLLSVPTVLAEETVMSVHKLGSILAAVVLLITSNTWAANITYNFVDYPLDEAKNSDGVQCWLSGTIVTDGTLGAYSDSSHILQFNFQVGSASSGGGGDPAPIMPISGPLFYATSSAILVPSGYGVNFYRYHDQPGNTTYFFIHESLTYNRFGEDSYSGSYSYNSGWRTLPGEAWHTTEYSGAFASDGAPQGYGSIGNNDPWVIATVVPEPSTVAMLLSLALGGLLWWRRRS